MKRHEFYTATGEVDKFFNMQSPEVADGILDLEEHKRLCSDAEKHIRGIFPMYSKRLNVVVARDEVTDFAGYTISYIHAGSTVSETLQFDFGEQGVDVV